MAHGTGQFKGLGRGWRKQVEYAVCNRCYGSGGGWGEVDKCDHCNGQGMVYELKPDAAKQKRIDARASHINNSINRVVYRNYTEKTKDEFRLREEIFEMIVRPSTGPQKVYTESPYGHIGLSFYRRELIKVFLDIADEISPIEAVSQPKC